MEWNQSPVPWEMLLSSGTCCGTWHWGSVRVTSPGSQTQEWCSTQMDPIQVSQGVCGAFVLLEPHSPFESTLSDFESPRPQHFRATPLSLGQSILPTQAFRSCPFNGKTIGGFSMASIAVKFDKIITRLHMFWDLSCAKCCVGSIPDIVKEPL